MSNNYEIRFAERKDVSLIKEFIMSIAEYEKMKSDVIASTASLEEWIFDKKIANVIFILEEGIEVGFALYFYNFSTFVGRAGLYLEDLFVKKEYRGKGYGRALFKKLAQIAKEEKLGRMEWVCLDWNKPSIDFYLSLGAKPMSDWTLYRLGVEEIKKVSELQIISKLN